MSYARILRAFVLASAMLVIGAASLPMANAEPRPAPKLHQGRLGSSSQVQDDTGPVGKISCLPSPPPSIEPSQTPTPSDEPSPPPSDSPTPEPSATDSPAPTDDMSPQPSGDPTPAPSDSPIPTPTEPPTPTPSPTPKPTPTPTPTPFPSHAPPPAPRLASPEIFGYLPYWDLSAQIDYGAITTIAYFGLGAGADGHLVRRDNNGFTTEYSRWQSAKVNTAITQAHANGDRFVLTVERMAWDDGGASATRALLNNPARRAILVSEIVDEVQARGLDGVSLDFEPILTDQRRNFESLLHELRVALDAANPMYQLTFAATGSQPGQTYQMIGRVTATGAADAVIIMGYPLRAIDANYAGGLAPLISPRVYDLKQITNAYLNTVAPQDIVLALPWYGRQWPTTTDQVNAPVQDDRSQFDRPYNISYANALQVAEQYGRQSDTGETSAWTAYQTSAGPGCPDTWQQVYYDDVETIGAKLDYISSKNLAGVGIFALGYDDSQPELWKLLRVKYRGLVDTTPPTGQISIVPDNATCQPLTAQLDLSADDGADGSGAVYLRLSNQPSVAADGTLRLGRTYPVTEHVEWPLDDATLGGSTDPGQHAVFAQWRDVSGNWSVPTSVPIDVAGAATATVTIGGGTSYVTSASVPVTVTQTGGRPITRVVLSSDPSASNGFLDRSQDVPLGNATSYSLVDPATGGADADGPRDIHVQWLDAAGCWSAPVDQQVTLDRTAPVGTLSIVDGASASLTGDAQLLAPATDQTSGVSAVQLSNDGITWTDAPASDAPIAWSAGSAPDGAWTISARWRDAAGNVSDVQTVSLSLDRHGPTGTLTLNGGAAFTGSDTVSVNAAADSTGLAVTQVRLANDQTLSNGALANGVTFAAGAPINWSVSGAAPAPDGPHTVYGQWQDSFGRWSPVASATITLDRTSPRVFAPYAALVPGSTLGNSAVSVGFVAQATDSGSGVARADASVARNGGPWAALSQDQVTSPAGIQIDTSSSWQLRLSAIDAAGNQTAPVTSAVFRAVVTQESATAVKYTGKWTKASNSGSSGGATRYATKKGASATFAFRGSSVGWAAPLSTKSGKAKVFVDGVLVATVDLRGTAQQRELVFVQTWATSATHTIKIKVLGTKGRARVDLDGFVVLG